MPCPVISYVKVSAPGTDQTRRESPLFDFPGDGVNIAARLEAMAPAGGICISGTIYDQISGKLAFQFDAMGERKVKNIARPVHAYRFIPDVEQKCAPLSDATKRPKGPERWRLRQLLALLLISCLAGLYVAWQTDITLFRRPAENPELKSIQGTVKQTPVIAVLPFENMSRDETFDHFADGLTDDIITNLSQLAGLSVIARNSVFTYKGRPVKTQVLAEELGVQFVLEGSIRGVAGQILMNAQLIDAPTGHHVWAERYDMKVEDLFAIQVDITTKIASALNISLTEKDEASLREKGAAYMEAYLEKLQTDGQIIQPEEQDTRAEMIYWESIKDSGNPAMFQEYLRQFPNGIFAGLAKINTQKPLMKKKSRQEHDRTKIAKIETPTVVTREKKISDTSKDNTEKKADTAQLEETFWRSIQGSKSIAEYEEFIHKFPDGLFAGLARIKIQAIADEAKKNRKPGDDGVIELAILPEKFDIRDPYFVNFQPREERKNEISIGVEMALSEKPLYAPKWSAFSTGNAPETKPIDNKILKDYESLWFRSNIFQDKKPKINAVCKFGDEIKVEAVLMMISTDYPPLYQRIDLFLIDTGAKIFFSETIYIHGRGRITHKDIHKKLLRLLDHMK